MKTYISIDGPSKAPHDPCIVFHKYDGSNMRFEWSPKRGWYKFGTRKCMVGEADHIYGRGVTLFKQKYGEALDKMFRTDKYFRSLQSAVAFGEFFGSKSFAGMHFPDDEKWDIVMFDMNLHKKGLMSPRDFINYFGHLPIAEVITECNFGEDLVQKVRKETIPLESKYEVRTDTPEGVICKGGSGHQLWMCKIKTERYKEKLKREYQADWERYWE